MLRLGEERRAVLLANVRNDAAWLRENGLMDYGLLVGVGTCLVSAVVAEKRREAAAAAARGERRREKLPQLLALPPQGSVGADHPPSSASTAVAAAAVATAAAAGSLPPVARANSSDDDDDDDNGTGGRREGSSEDAKPTAAADDLGRKSPSLADLLGDADLDCWTPPRPLLVEEAGGVCAASLATNARLSASRWNAEAAAAKAAADTAPDGGDDDFCGACDEVSAVHQGLYAGRFVAFLEKHIVYMAVCAQSS